MEGRNRPKTRGKCLWTPGESRNTHKKKKKNKKPQPKTTLARIERTGILKRGGRKKNDCTDLTSTTKKKKQNGLKMEEKEKHRGLRALQAGIPGKKRRKGTKKKVFHKKPNVNDKIKSARQKKNKAH